MLLQVAQNLSSKPSFGFDFSRLKMIISQLEHIYISPEAFKVTSHTCYACYGSEKLNEAHEAV